MIINIDTEQKKLTFKDGKKIKKKYSLFNYLSYKILKSFWEEYSWHFKYTYQFSWLGFPIIQLPDDIIQIQEFLFKEKPDFIVIFPWNIKDEIIDQLKFTKKWGCKFVVAIPSLSII